MEETLSADYTTTEEKFNIRRASSPISLHKRNSKDSYSEKTKQKTTFEEKETEKGTRTDRQPRPQNKIQPTEQQTPQRKRRAEVNSPERPMSRERRAEEAHPGWNTGTLPPAEQELPNAQRTTTTAIGNLRSIRHRTAPHQQEEGPTSTHPAPPATKWSNRIEKSNSN
jgi:hypothetical protein